tara:strand:+ start:692 stop:1282 length:591 start_codon:yes stop_codon:yes gene_type:complete
MKIGLFFGSFNPMHIGHNVIASYMVEFSDLDKIMFVVSPQSPLKKKESLLNQHHRLMIIRMAIEDNPKILVSDVEFNLPQPSYTIDTLIKLKEQNNEHEYALILGADNLQNFKKWKNYREILENYTLYIYPRPGIEINLTHKNICIIKGVPQMEVSASLIRRLIREGKDASYLMPEKAWKYTNEMNFYRKYVACKK